ncbi:condensation domain-containing protein [Nocardia sp. NPDC050435]|uniref:condensation domain-containing protein n=1 Tax=Nocardia sp. NPDC050435 TaxID=3155040 RepID=UPI0033DB59B0
MPELSPVKRALLEQWRTGRRVTSPQDITRHPAGSATRGSIQQKELWNLHQRSTGTTSSNITFAGTVAAALDAGALREAVAALTRRHEILRTTLSVDDNDTVWQHVHPEPLTELTVTDLSTLDPQKALARARALANEAAAKPFDLSAGPLLRPVLYQLGPDQSMLALIVHHAVADGWSLAIAMQEISQYYEALIDARHHRPESMSVQYKDFSEWQWRWMDSPEALAHARYWEDKMSQHVATLLPTDFPRGEKKDLRGGLLELNLTADLSTAVRELAQREQASVYMVLFAAFVVLLREQTDEAVVSIGTPVAGRNRPETHQLIGCFASMVPTVTTVDDQKPFRDLLRVVRAELANAVAYEEYSLDMYLNWVEPDRDFVSKPMYAAMFGMQPPMRTFELAGARVRPINLDRGETRTPIAVHLWNAEPMIHGTVGYARALFRDSTVESMITRYVEILRSATGDPGRRVRDLLVSEVVR